MTNPDIARHLEEIADALEQSGADDHRISAYRRAARVIADRERSVAETVRSEGAEAITEIRGIGDSLSRLIGELVSSGTTQLHRRVTAAADPSEVFADLPGIGTELGGRIQDELEISTLEALEAAAHDGRLESVSGVGAETAQAVREVLATRLGRSRRSGAGSAERPPAELLREIDAEYREKAARGELRTIAPKRFNPERRAWLPIMEVERGGFEFTVLFSNTAKAHRKGKTHDWVVIYFRRKGSSAEGQATVITGKGGERVIPSY